MAILQSVNGKAPSGAKVGDSIVTNGGTYKITGQNPDGSWISQKVSDVHTNRYPSTSGSSSTSPSSSSSSSSTSTKFPSGGGSASSVNVYDDWQQSIKDQMNANSQAWHNATTQEEKDRLHQENINLAGMLGGNISYDGHTGQWTGSSAAPELPAFTMPGMNISGGNNYTPTDNSEYLEEMAAAYLEQQKEALKQAYEQNLSNLQAEQDKLGANYQAARNQEAADNALARKRWNETAAAYGLNSGTQGQAQLSYANQLQSDLSALQAAESAANAEVERQRTDLGKQYQSALEEAVAENNYALYEKLYQEAVRVDQALQQQSQFNAQLALQQYQAMLDKYYNDLNFQYAQNQNNRSEQLAAAELLAQSGDYSAYGDLFGWDAAKVQQMENAWNAANTAVNTSGGGSSGGGSGASYGGTSSNTSSIDPLQDAYDYGVRSYASALAYFKKLGYNDSIAQELAESFYDEYDSGNFDVDMNSVYQYYNNIIDAHEPGIDKGSADYVPMMIMKYNDQGYLNAAEVRELFKLFGLNPNDYGA